MTLEQEINRIVMFARSVESQAKTLEQQIDALKEEAAWLHSFAVTLANRHCKIEQVEQATTTADALRRCTGSVSVTYDDGRGNIAVSKATR